MQAIISIPRLRAALNGRVITPGDTGYDHARTVFYGGFDQRRPAVIMRAADATDVAPIPEQAHGKPIVMALLCWAGEVEAGERAIARFRGLAPPFADLV
jgi:hypothetical protein